MPARRRDRKSTRLNSSHLVISYAVFCLKKKNSIGLAQYATYIFPGLGNATKVTLPVLGGIEINAIPVAMVAIAALAVAVFLLYRRITLVERLAKFLWVGVMLTIAWVIFAGVSHFDPKLAFDFPAGAFTLRPEFFTGLGAALLVAVYDYWGYYNVCFFGGEVKRSEERRVGKECRSRWSPDH